MPDANGNLIASDVESYTGGRLSASKPETLRALNAAQAAVRRYCGWHVSPILQTTLTLDGNGRRELWLPSLKIVSINSLTVFDSNLGEIVDIDVNDPTQFAMSSEAPGVIYRGPGTGRWNWGVGNVTVDFTHGFSDAYDWQAAVLELVDRMAAQVGNVMGTSGPMTQKKVDDVTYTWAGPSEVKGAATEGLFGGMDHSLIDHYRLYPFA